MPANGRLSLFILFDAPVAAAAPAGCLAPHLPPPPRGRMLVIGAGKGAASMAQSIEAGWSGSCQGWSARATGTACRRRIEVVAAVHPVPDAAGGAADARMWNLVHGRSADDLLISLISGGGSALLALPANGLPLEDKRQVNRSLLKSGADITEMNCVRKHLPASKGGRPAAACAPAQVLALTISDVPGDSGRRWPTAAAAPTRWPSSPTAISQPKAAVDYTGRRQDAPPKPRDPRLGWARQVMIATPQMPLEAAAEMARADGMTPRIRGNALEAEARAMALVPAVIARHVLCYGPPTIRPCVLLSGGEGTVTCGAAAAAGAISSSCWRSRLRLAASRGSRRLHATPTASAAPETTPARCCRPTRWRAPANGLHAPAYLTNSDGYSLFAALDDLLVT